MEDTIQRSRERQSAINAQFLTFFVNGEEYGVDILRVQEIRGWTDPMPVPNASAYVKGVINIRATSCPSRICGSDWGCPNRFGPRRRRSSSSGSRSFP